MIKKKDIKKLYNQYDERVQNYMFQIYNFLENKFGEVDSSWNLNLDMLANYVDTYVRCSDQIKQDGLMIENRFQIMEKHPLLKVQLDVSIQIQKICDSFGLTLKSLSKLRTEENDDDGFLEDLMGE